MERKLHQTLWILKESEIFELHVSFCDSIIAIIIWISHDARAISTCVRVSMSCDSLTALYGSGNPDCSKKTETECVYVWKCGFNVIHLCILWQWSGICIPPPTIVGRARMFWGLPSIRPFVKFSRTWLDISVYSRLISINLVTDIHHVSGNCYKGFQGQRSRSSS